MADHRNIRAAGARPNLTEGVRIKEHVGYEEHRKGSQRASQSASKAIGALQRMEGKGALGVATQARHAAALATAAAEGHNKAARLTNSPRVRASHEHLARAHTLSAKYLAAKADAARAPGASHSVAGQTFSYMRQHAAGLSHGIATAGGGTVDDHRGARDAHRAAAAAAMRPGAHTDPAAAHAAAATHTKAAAAHARGAVTASRDAGAGAARVRPQLGVAGHGYTASRGGPPLVKINRIPSAGPERAKTLAAIGARVGGRGAPAAAARLLAAAGAAAPRTHVLNVLGRPITGATGAKMYRSEAASARKASAVGPAAAGRQATRGAQMPPALKGVSGWAIWRAKNKWRVK